MSVIVIFACAGRVSSVAWSREDAYWDQPLFGTQGRKDEGLDGRVKALVEQLSIDDSSFELSTIQLMIDLIRCFVGRL